MSTLHLDPVKTSQTGYFHALTELFLSLLDLLESHGVRHRGKISS